MFSIPRIQHFGVDPLRISSAAFLHGLAFVVLSIFVIHNIKKLNLIKEQFDKKIAAFIFYIIIFSLFGGRIWFAIFDRRGWDVWYDVINPNVAGLTSFGMLIGGAIGIFFAVRRIGIKKISNTVKIIDIVTFFLPIWIAIYRVGCTLHGCCFGKRTDVAWGMQYIGSEAVRHPTQIYSIINALLIFGILWFFFRKDKTKHTRLGKRFDGEVALWFLILYSIGRFTIDFFRWYPDAQYWWVLTIGQWTCAVIFIISLTMIIITYNAIRYLKIRSYTESVSANKKNKSLGLEYLKRRF